MDSDNQRLWPALRDIIQAIDDFHNRNRSLINCVGREELLKRVAEARVTLHNTHDLMKEKNARSSKN